MATKKKTSAKKNTATKKTSPSAKKVESKTVVQKAPESSANSILLGIVLAIVVINLIFTLILVTPLSQKVDRIDSFFENNFDNYGSGETQTGTQTPTGNTQAPSQEVSVNLEGVRSVGDENAPVVMTKYSDFRCGFCQRFHLETYDKIVEEYVETGQVRFVYKDFPVVGGNDAANAGWCAYEQGKFEEFKDGLFALGAQRISDSSMRSLAESLNMDLEEYDECYSTQEYNDRVLAEAQEAQANGLSGTPSFIINGQVLVGAQPFSAFQQVIESELSN